MKVVINSLLGTSMATFAESVALGRALGLSEEMLFDVLIGGAATALFFAMKRDRMVNDVDDVQFPLQWMRKDEHIASEAAEDVDYEMPLSAAR